jgi:hypothetical protein
MFFNIVRDNIDQLDKGWQALDDFLYKGYCIGSSLKDLIESRNFKQKEGNYCIINRKQPAIYHDDFRSFPLFTDNDRCSNSYFSGSKKIHFPTTVDFKNTWCENYIGYEDLEYDPITFSFHGLADYICERLVYLVEQTQFEFPLLAADTHGVDSTLVRSVFDYVGKEYKLVRREKMGDDDHWGYRQLYPSADPHIQITGYCGDEVLVRNPMYCQWLLSPHNVDLIDEYNKIEKSYMLGFFMKNYKKKLTEDQHKFDNNHSAFNHVRDWVMNDFQMWHKDDTITFTPLRDRKILKACLQAEPDAIIRQCVHAELSTEIIRRLNPKNLDTISQHKNAVKP